MQRPCRGDRTRPQRHRPQRRERFNECGAGVIVRGVIAVREVVLCWWGSRDDGSDDVGYLLVLYGLPFYGFGDFVGYAEFVLLGVYANVDCFVEVWDVDFASDAGDVFPYTLERFNIFLGRIHHHLSVSPP